MLTYIVVKTPMAPTELFHEIPLWLASGGVYTSKYNFGRFTAQPSAMTVFPVKCWRKTARRASFLATFMTVKTLHPFLGCTACFTDLLRVLVPVESLSTPPHGLGVHRSNFSGVNTVLAACFWKSCGDGWISVV